MHQAGVRVTRKLKRWLEEEKKTQFSEILMEGPQCEYGFQAFLRAPKFKADFYCKIKDKIVMDPNIGEELVMDARITMTFEKDGKICAVQKGGSGYFTMEQILNFAKEAEKKAKELREILVK